MRDVGLSPQRLTLYVVLVAFLVISGCQSDSALKEFSSDGCTLFADLSFFDEKNWCECCFRHDLAYWQGGTEEQRKKADLDLKRCVLQKTNDRGLAEVMYQGVRFGGSPYFPNWYRWGYGWPYERKYQQLTGDEKELVKKRLDDYFKNNPTLVCE